MPVRTNNNRINARPLTARDAALRALSDVIVNGAYASQAIDR